jgi:hypothetical protein
MKVWYDDELYDVKKIFRPTRHDMYLLCQRKEIGSVHMDDKTTPIEMILLDVHNDMFMIDSRKSREMVKQKREFALNKAKVKREENATSIWLKNIEQLEKCAK